MSERYGWTKQPSGWTRDLGVIQMGVSHRRGGWRFTVAGIRGEGFHATAEEAMESAEQAARRLLTEALAALDRDGSPRTPEED